MTISTVLIALIGVMHVYIFVLEMFLWDTPKGMRAFGNNAEQAEQTKVLAKNMGLYNGFLAAGLFWSLLAEPHVALANFFLGCVLIAGIYGGVTANKKIIYIQAIPALITLILLNLGK